MNAFEFAVAYNLCIGIVEFQRVEQREELLLLGCSSCIGGATFLIKSAFVTNADGVGIVVAGVGSDFLIRTTLMQLAIACDVIVVAGTFPAASLVHLVEQFG